MRVWTTAIGMLTLGAVGGYKTVGSVEVNPFHKRTYEEEIIYRGAAPSPQQMEEILSITSGKEYRRTMQINDLTETLTYSPQEGIMLVIEQPNAERITYVDKNADGFAEKHIVGANLDSVASHTHYCIPNSVPNGMYRDPKFHDPEAREGKDGVRDQRDYFVALKNFEESEKKEANSQ